MDKLLLFGELLVLVLGTLAFIGALCLTLVAVLQWQREQMRARDARDARAIARKSVIFGKCFRV